MRSLLHNEHKEPVELEQDDQTVLTCEEDVHVADDTKTKNKGKSEADEGDVLGGENSESFCCG